jgi:hypothetical protein
MSGACAGNAYVTALADLNSYGYVEHEYFLEGTATAYDYARPPGNDGMWSVTAKTTAPYKTRLIVRRPTDPMKFNGTVVVEWFNESSGVDADPDWIFAHVELIRSGFGYVGVSAQAGGIAGGGFGFGSLLPGLMMVPLVQADSQRYGSLQHPGDDYSYDIFTQAARVLRSPGSVDPLGGLKAVRLIGDGESQSSGRIVTYVNAIQPITNAFDGFFIHSRFGGGAALSSSGGGGAAGLLMGGPSAAHIRSDLKVPVFQFETETDVLGMSFGQGFSSARQPDTPLLRTWEVAGTSHIDGYTFQFGQQESSQIGDADCGASAADAGGSLVSAFASCGTINHGPQHWVMDTAFRALHKWMKDGTAPVMGSPLEIADNGTDYRRDSYGNALGGVRTPAVDVPIAVYSGQNSGGILCSLFGKTTPFTAAQLTMLYPTHDDYVGKVMAAAMRDEQAGFLLTDDVPLIIQEAQSAAVPQ